MTHLRTVAEQAARFAEGFGGAELAHYVGLWHDLGKFNPRFQEYLFRCEADLKAKGSGPEHKAAGAQLCRQSLGPLSLLVHRHHGGLKTPTELEKWLGERKKDPALQHSLELARREVPDLVPPTRPAMPPHVRDPLAAEFFMRMLFSALVDADHLDTEAHFNAGKSALRGTDVGLGELSERFERHQREVAGDGEGTVNRVRREVYEACLVAAKQPTHIPQ